MGASGTLSLLFIALISFAPLTATTFVGARMGYRGMALITPWAAVVVIALLVGWGLRSIGELDNRTSYVSAWAGAMLIGGYFVTLAHLIVLASRRLPKKPGDEAEVF